MRTDQFWTLIVLWASVLMVVVWMLIRQNHIDYLQDRKTTEWFNNAEATLEGMEYEMTRLKNAIDTTATYGK